MNMLFSKRRRGCFPVKLFAVLLAALMSGACAAAEEPECLFETYVQAVSADAQWETDGAEQIRMLGTDEGVTVSACLEGENVAALTVEYPAGQIPDMAKRFIENLGWLSAESLEAVYVMEADTSGELEGCSVRLVHGELRDAVSICRAEDVEGMVWQPIHGGARIHDKPRCSGMDVSRMITVEAAQAVGWEDCGHCRKNK